MDGIEREEFIPLRNCPPELASDTLNPPADSARDSILASSK